MAMEYDTALLLEGRSSSREVGGQGEMTPGRCKLKSNHPQQQHGNFSLTHFLHVHLCVQTLWKCKHEQETKSSRKTLFQQRGRVQLKHSQFRTCPKNALHAQQKPPQPVAELFASPLFPTDLKSKGCQGDARWSALSPEHSWLSAGLVEVYKSLLLAPGGPLTCPEPCRGLQPHSTPAAGAGVPEQPCARTHTLSTLQSFPWIFVTMSSINYLITSSNYGIPPVFILIT